MAGIKGLESFTDVLEILKDPSKYEAKLKEIKKATADYEVVVNAVVDLSKVNDYTNNIRFREEESKHTLQSAKVQAEKILADALGKAEVTRVEVEKMLSEANEFKNLNKHVNKELKDQLKAVQDEKVALDRMAVDLENKALALDTLEKELVDKRTKLLNALS
jgi:purine-nucleoside phosphorylase